MAYLTLDGVPVPIAVDSGDREIEVIADRERAADTGRLLESRTAVKQRLAGLRTALLPLADAEALQMKLASATVGAPLLCAGDLVGATPLSCVAEGRVGLRVQTLAGGERRGVVTFTLMEV